MLQKVYLQSVLNPTS